MKLFAEVATALLWLGCIAWEKKTLLNLFLKSVLLGMALWGSYLIVRTGF